MLVTANSKINKVLPLKKVPKGFEKLQYEAEAKVVWNFSENSSVLVKLLVGDDFPYPRPDISNCTQSVIET